VRASIPPADRSELACVASSCRTLWCGKACRLVPARLRSALKAAPCRSDDRGKRFAMLPYPLPLSIGLLRSARIARMGLEPPRQGRGDGERGGQETDAFVDAVMATVTDLFTECQALCGA
jgi:hypothetical protein